MPRRKAAAKRDAANTRRKLMESASELAGEPDTEEACVVRLGAREESQEQPKRQNQPRQSRRKNNGEDPADSQDADNSISDWV